MAIDEAAQSSTPEDNVAEKAPTDDAIAGDNAVVVDNVAIDPRT